MTRNPFVLLKERLMARTKTTNVEQPLLSFCIPTFNRAELVTRLVVDLLSQPGPFEICVHVDGSTDDTLERLQATSNPKLFVRSSENRGRGQALRSAVQMACGKFVILFDDDDKLSPEGLAKILSDCGHDLPDGCTGYIYQLETPDGQPVGTRFPVERANLISLRADHKVTGDKKEVVCTKKLQAELAKINGSYRRIPTSLYWARLALQGDIICCNDLVGTKNYLTGGMSDTINRLKRDNAWPIVMLNATIIRAYFNGRYTSPRYLARALAATAYYTLFGLLSAFNAALKR